MGKRLIEAAINTRNSRARLASGLHWRAIDPDVHLGYRRNARGGKWVVRWREGKGYKQGPLGTADDTFDGDGVHTLSFAQASSAARRHVDTMRGAKIASEAALAAGPPLTIQTAVEEYLVTREARENTQKGGIALKRDARSRLTKHVLSNDEIANSSFFDLTESVLKNWLKNLPQDLAPSTVRRLVNDFKAALNSSAAVHRARAPGHIAAVIKHGLKLTENSSPVAREAQILSDSEVRDIMSAANEVDSAGQWDGDLARLIAVLAASGARFSQVTRMTVADVQFAHGRIMIPVSRKGRSVKATPKIAVRIGEDVLAMLRPVVAGRKSSDVLFLRPRWKQLSPTVWTKIGRDPWKSASELQRAWAAIVEKAELPSDTIPYSLRHSNIVRGLRAGLPVRLVAATHDTSTAMIERHYSAYIVDALDELSARAIIPLTSTGTSPNHSAV